MNKTVYTYGKLKWSMIIIYMVLIGVLMLFGWFLYNSQHPIVITLFSFWLLLITFFLYRMFYRQIILLKDSIQVRLFPFRMIEIKLSKIEKIGVFELQKSIGIYNSRAIFIEKKEDDLKRFSSYPRFIFISTEKNLTFQQKLDDKMISFYYRDKAWKELKQLLTNAKNNMKQELGLLLVGLFMSTNLFAQKATFYKDENFWKETSEKKAKFKKTESYKADTLLIQSRRISDNLLLAESKWIGDKAVGIWTKYDLKGNLISSRNFGILVYSNEPINEMYDNNKDNEDCKDCELASYPSGENGMFQFIGTKIRYPTESKDMGNSGTVYLRFIIDKEGNAIAHSIIRGVDPFIDMEAWQLIEKMPKWSPATKNGESVESYWTLPIRFTLR